MLKLISWKEFIATLILMLAIYYSLLLLFFYRKETTAFLNRLKKIRKPGGLSALIGGILLTASASAMAQTADGTFGINQANTMIRSYYDPATQVMYAVGALFGLIGAVKVFQKVVQGNEQAGTVAAAWFIACIFLVVSATVIKSFFGI